MEMVSLRPDSGSVTRIRPSPGNRPVSVTAAVPSAPVVTVSVADSRLGVRLSTSSVFPAMPGWSVRATVAEPP